MPQQSPVWGLGVGVCKRPLESPWLVLHPQERLALYARLAGRAVCCHAGTGNLEGAHDVKGKLREELPGFARGLQLHFRPILYQDPTALMSASPTTAHRALQLRHDGLLLLEH